MDMKHSRQVEADAEGFHDRLVSRICVSPSPCSEPGRKIMNRRRILSGAASLGAAFAAAGPALGDGAAPAQSAIDRFVAALNAHDIKAFADLFAEDYVNHQTSAAAPAPPDKIAKAGDGRLLQPPAERPCRPRRARRGLACIRATSPRRASSTRACIAPSITASRRPAGRCASPPATSSASATGASRNIGAWATSRACSRN